MTAYAELDLVTNFSFLEGGSHPAELVIQAKALGLNAIGIADRNTLAGVVRAHVAAKQHGMKILIGCRLAFRDGTELIVYPRDRAAYGRLCRLLSLGKSRVANIPEEAPTPPCGEDALDEDRIPKNETWLDFTDAVAHGEGLIAIARAPDSPDAAFETRLKTWRKAWPDCLYLGVNLLQRGSDRARLVQLSALALAADAPLVATNAVLYHHFERRPLQDVLTCIREKTTIDEAGFKLQANAERYLKPPAEMARLFKSYEEILARTIEIAAACRFNLDELKYHYPNEPIPPGRTANQHLRHLVCKGARERWPDGPPRLT